MSLKIRWAEKTDSQLIVDLIRELARFEKLEDQVVNDKEKTLRTIFSEKPDAEVLIAEWDGKPAGFALFFQSYSTFRGQPGIFLEDLFILPEFRSRGIGESLLRHLAGLAKERNCARLEWWVLNWNKRAIEFYESLGAKPMSEWTPYRVTGQALDELAQGGPQ